MLAHNIAQKPNCLQFSDGQLYISPIKDSVTIRVLGNQLGSMTAPYPQTKRVGPQVVAPRKPRDV